jgi:hypothetical protein
LRATLFVIDSLVALTAIAGGIAFVTGLESGRFPPTLLAGTLFKSYVAPGFVLGVAVGGSAPLAGVLGGQSDDVQSVAVPCVRRSMGRPRSRGEFDVRHSTSAPIDAALRRWRVAASPEATR